MGTHPIFESDFDCLTAPMSDAQVAIRNKRLKTEIENIKKDPPPGCSAWIKDLATLEANIEGVGPYDDGLFRLRLIIPKRYPFEPPETKFLTRIYHPNIDSAGRICLDMHKKDHWKPSMNIRTLLLSIQSLLGDPNPDDPLEATIAKEYRTDRKKFLDTARKWTKE